MLLSQADDIVYLARVVVCYAQLPVLGLQHCINYAPWCMPVILVLKSEREGNYKLKVILSYRSTLRAICAAWVPDYKIVIIFVIAVNLLSE